MKTNKTMSEKHNNKSKGYNYIVIKHNRSIAYGGNHRCVTYMRKKQVPKNKK